MQNQNVTKRDRKEKRALLTGAVANLIMAAFA